MGLFVYSVVLALAVGGLCYFNGYQRGSAAGIIWAEHQIYD